MRRTKRIAMGCALGLGAVVLTGMLECGRVMADPTNPPASRPIDPALAKRLKWEAVVTLYGEEDTNEYSLRILDRSVTEPADFVFHSLWKYDAATNAWTKLTDDEQTSKIYLPANKPVDSPVGNQLLAVLPMKLSDTGLFYATWTVNGVDGSTYSRIGPTTHQKRPDLGKIPTGTLAEQVPLNINKAEWRIIPDPRIHTASTKPAAEGKS